MTRVDVQQAQANLTQYLEQVARGEIIQICKDAKPVAELRPIQAARQTPRPVGLGQGQGIIYPSFHEPLPDDLLGAFEGVAQ